MEKIPLYLDRKLVTFIGFRFVLKVFIFFSGQATWLYGSKSSIKFLMI